MVLFVFEKHPYLTTEDTDRAESMLPQAGLPAGMFSERLGLLARVEQPRGTTTGPGRLLTRRVARIILPRLRGHPVYDDEPRTTKEEKGKGEGDERGAVNHERSDEAEKHTEENHERGDEAEKHIEENHERGAGRHSAGGVAIHSAGAAGGQDGSGLCLAEARAQAATRGATGGHEHEEKNENEANRAGASSGGDNENHGGRRNATNHTPLWRGLWSTLGEGREERDGRPLG